MWPSPVRLHAGHSFSLFSSTLPNKTLPAAAQQQSQANLHITPMNLLQSMLTIGALAVATASAQPAEGQTPFIGKQQPSLTSDRMTPQAL